MKRIVILGATGSIGTQTFDVVRACPDRLTVIGLSAHHRWQELFEQAREFEPRWIALTDEELRETVLAVDGALPANTTLLWGDAAVKEMVTHPDVDVVVAAMVGAAGLFGAIKALEAGKTVALANKETLVVGGPIVTALANRRKHSLLPVDSEHSAIFQCLQAGSRAEVARIILTASGGPFRHRPLGEFDSITPEEALKHPTWNMGPKITVDSATMMNKALEIIEAHWLFGLEPDRIDVAIHPQSMVHSLVEYIDGSVIAQVSPPDMRLPIQYALTFPDRCDGPARRLDLAAASRWEFFPVDRERYPAIALGYEVIARGGTSGAALNAANEVAVARFLSGEIRFSDIVPLCREVLNAHPLEKEPSLESLLRVDRWARQESVAWKPLSNPQSVSSKS